MPEPLVGSFKALLSREMNLKSASSLLQLGKSLQGWLASEVRVARALSFEIHPEHLGKVEADLRALAQFEGYATLLADLKVLLKTLQKGDLLIQDEDLEVFEKQLREHESLDWDICQLASIQRFSKSHVMQLEVASAEAAALHSLIQQAELMQMLLQGFFSWGERAQSSWKSRNPHVSIGLNPLSTKHPYSTRGARIKSLDVPCSFGLQGGSTVPLNHLKLIL